MEKKRYNFYYLENLIDTVLAKNFAEAERIFYGGSFKNRFEIKEENK